MYQINETKMSHQTTSAVANVVPTNEKESEQKDEDRLPFALSSHFSSILRLDNMKPSLSQQTSPYWTNSHHNNLHTVGSSSKASENPSFLSTSSNQSYIPNKEFNLTKQHEEQEQQERNQSSFENLLDFIGTCPSLIMDISSTHDPRWMDSTLLPSLMSSSTNSVEYGHGSGDSKDFAIRHQSSPQNEHSISTLPQLDPNREFSPCLQKVVKNDDPFSEETTQGLTSLHQECKKERMSIDNNRYFCNHELTLPKGCSYPVSSMILSENSFQVSTTLWNTDVSQVMGILSDPNTFPLWYHPMIGAVVIITDEKGGSLSTSASGSSRTRSDTLRFFEVQDREMHDGLWIEAVTTCLTPPTSHLSLLYNCVATFRSCLGCPSSGTIQLFVERQRGQVGFTIGKFHGGIILSHSILIKEGVGNDGTVYLVDTIHVQHEEDEVYRNSFTAQGSSSNPSSVLGGILFHRFYAPSMHNFLHQTTSSFKSLGQLIHPQNPNFENDSSVNRNNSQDCPSMGLHLPLIQNVY